MISKITINNAADLPISWWHKSKCLQDIKEITFTPGLNILWGKNGSGKSSVLRLLAKMFHAEAGRHTFITHTSTHDLIPYKKGKDVFASCTIEHDNQGIMFYDPEHRVGLVGGMAGFDWDFGDAGIRSMMVKGSSGELVLHNMFSLLEGMKKGDKIAIKYKDKPRLKEGEELKGDSKRIAEFMKGTLSDGPPTFILDEPDRSIDIPNQLRLWLLLRKMSEKAQIIVASHSTFAVEITGANYIEFSGGYLGECRKAING